MSSLTSLVQQQHLGDDAVGVYRTSFDAQPARFLVLEDFLVPKFAARLSNFLAGEAEFAAEYGLHGIDDRKVTEEEWNAAGEDERFFRFSKLVGTRPEFQMSDNSLAYLRLRSTFQSNVDLRLFFEAVTGLDLAASADFGSHCMGTGDFLKEHDDDNRNRRLALVLYLAPDWQAEYGGSLKIIDADGRESNVEARYNSLVAFDTRAGTSHYVVPIGDAAGARKRLTIGGWYHQPT